MPVPLNHPPMQAMRAMRAMRHMQQKQHKGNTRHTRRCGTPARKKGLQCRPGLAETVAAVWAINWPPQEPQRVTA